MGSIYELVGWVDILAGLAATFLSLFTANWIGLVLGLAVMAHGAAWEKLEEDLNNLSRSQK